MHTSTTIPATIRRWHEMLADNDPARLDALLADEVVFHSPVVHTPQSGRAITTQYLRAAFEVLNGPDFRYVNQWFGTRSADRACAIAFGTT